MFLGWENVFFWYLVVFLKTLFRWLVQYKMKKFLSTSYEISLPQMTISSKSDRIHGSNHQINWRPKPPLMPLGRDQSLPTMISWYQTTIGSTNHI